MRVAIVLPLATLAACAHPEDRRWNAIAPAQAPLDHAWKPTLSVYSFATPPEVKPPLQLRDLAGEGQAAYVAELSRASDPQALRLALATPIGPSAGIAPYAPPSLDRTVVIDVQKPVDAALGDRIARSVVTLVPGPGYQFASYSVVATDNQVQNIAHLETATAASVEATLSPTIKGTGDNAVAAKTSRTHTSAADISATYEKLNVRIEPELIVITRESERGLDVVGNTILKVKLATIPTDRVLPRFLATSQALFTGDGPLPAGKASLEITGVEVPYACDQTATVGMKYLIRRVTKGQHYYTEGKQEAAYETGEIPVRPAVLVAAQEIAPPLWEIHAGGTPLDAAKPGLGARRLVFNSYDAAQIFAEWLRRGGGARFANGITLQATAPVHDVSVAKSPNGCPAG